MESINSLSKNMELTDNFGNIQSNVQSVSQMDTNTDYSQMSQEEKITCEIKKPFKLSEKQRQNDFQVEFNNSVSTNPSQTIDSVKNKIIPFKKKKGKLLDSAFNVSFNDSTSINASSVASSLPKKKVLPFKNKKKKSKQRNSFFKIGFEESPNFNTTTSPDHVAKRKTIFPRKDLAEDAFHVGYMESSVSTINEISPFCFDNQVLPFKNNTKSKEDGFNINFEDTENINNTELSLSAEVANAPFPKKVSKINNFNVSFNESVQKVSNENNSSNELSIGNEIANSSSARNHSTNMSSKLNFSCSKSFLNKMEDISLTKNSNAPHLSQLGLDQSSYNDENLKGYFSDQSDENPEQNENFQNIVASILCTPPEDPAEISQEEDQAEISQEEDREKILELKLKAIVENASKIAKSQETIMEVKSSRAFKKVAFSGRRLPKPKLKKPAPYVTRRLYDYLIGKLRPKYGIDSALKAEEIVIIIYETVKTVIRRKSYQKKLIHDLKVEMAKAGLVECTYDFYDFVREFLPYEFREKVIPCIQPITNIVYPPRDAKNPFDKIL